MTRMIKPLTIVTLLLALGACTTTLSEQDRALLTSASQNAEAAKQQSAQAQATAQQALQAARAAETAANRNYQQSLHK